MSYISGVLEGYRVTAALELTAPVICLPDVLSRKDAVDAVVGFLKSNQKQQGLAASEATILAAQRVYPCKIQHNPEEEKPKQKGT
jgi:hypothetical protein